MKTKADVIIKFQAYHYFDDECFVNICSVVFNKSMPKELLELAIKNLYEDIDEHNFMDNRMTHATIYTVEGYYEPPETHDYREVHPEHYDFRLVAEEKGDD